MAELMVVFRLLQFSSGNIDSGGSDWRNDLYVHFHYVVPIELSTIYSDLKLKWEHIL